MFLIVLFVIGITAEGATGALAAGRERMDLFGVAIIACVTAIGGGSVRDVLLGNYPLVWVENPMYLVFVLVAAFVTVAIPVMMNYFHWVFLILDAVGLSVFTVLGTQIALGAGHGALIAIVAAVLTGVFGGVLRDIMSNRVPLVFQGDLYASVAVSGSILYLALNAAGVNDNVNAIIVLAFTFGLRLCAIFFHWSLPVFEYQEREFTRDREHSLSNRLLNKARELRPAGPRQLRITEGIAGLRHRHHGENPGATATGKNPHTGGQPAPEGDVQKECGCDCHGQGDGDTPPKPGE